LFLYLVAVLGISALLLLFNASPRAQAPVFKAFLVVVFIRFALGLAVALNSGVDYLFLDQQLQANDAGIENFQSNIIGIESDDEFDADSVRESAFTFWRGLSLDELERKISDGIENFINLVAIYLLKTIVFPLGFFYAAFFFIKLLWRVELNITAPS
jgi:hypothetical protein